MDERQTPPPSVELHIGELVVHGFPVADRAQLGAVVRQELARLFAERGVPAGLEQGGEIASVDGGELQVAPGGGTPSLGAEIARAVYGGLGR
jgi:hypothetical protein